LGAAAELPLVEIESAIDTASRLVGAAIAATHHPEWVIQTPDGDFVDVVEAPDARAALKLAAKRRELPSVSALLKYSGVSELMISPLGDAVRYSDGLS